MKFKMKLARPVDEYRIFFKVKLSLAIMMQIAIKNLKL